MNSSKGLAATLVCLILLTVAGYIWYRHQAIQSLKSLGTTIVGSQGTRGLLQDIRSLPPIQCEQVETGFSVATHRRIYIAHGKMRIQVENLTKKDSDVSEDVQILFDETGVYGWQSGDEDVYRWNIDRVFPAGSGLDNPLLMIRTSDCRPWWSVDDVLMNIPAGLNIVEERA